MLANVAMNVCQWYLLPAHAEAVAHKETIYMWELCTTDDNSNNNDNQQAMIVGYVYDNSNNNDNQQLHWHFCAEAWTKNNSTPYVYFGLIIAPICRTQWLNYVYRIYQKKLESSNSMCSNMFDISNLGELVVEVAAGMISVKSDSEVIRATPHR